MSEYGGRGGQRHEEMVRWCVYNERADSAVKIFGIRNSADITGKRLRRLTNGLPCDFPE